MNDVKFSKEKPRIYKKLVKKFGIDWERGIIITYGNTVYCKYDLSPAKVIHESTHVKQQEAMGKWWWWRKYIKDANFRMSQEVEAYKNEVDFIRKTIKNREIVNKMLVQIARDLSSSIYGNLISYDEALKFVKYNL